MKVEIKGDEITITLPIEEKLSKSEKNLLIASTAGNKESDCKYKGKPVVVSVNCYIAPPKAKGK